MNETVLWGAIELGLVYSLASLGVYLTFRMAKMADLTVDGSFTLGAVVAATCLLKGYHPLAANALALGAGALAGCTTAYLIRILKVDGMLPSILTMMALYSINLRILGKPNAALLDEKNILDVFISERLGLFFFAVLAVFSLAYYLSTHHGLALRAAGANPTMAKALGVKPSRMMQWAFVVGNMLVGLSGALFAQTQGFVDVSMGTGTVILGLAAVLIGEAILPTRRLALQLFSCVLGTIVYRILLAFALDAEFLGLQASDLNLITTVLVVLALLLSRFRHGIFARFKRGAL